jgi:hypothetical protein
MPSMFTTHTFTNGSVIDSNQMNTNFNDVKAAFNTNAVQVDGTVQATTASLGAGIVTNAKLADLSVTQTKIADVNVTTAKIADLAVTNAKIADSTIAIGKLASSVVSSGTWTPVSTYNYSGTSGGSWYKVGDIMTFYGWVLLTGTISGGNTITVSLPSGEYGSEAQSSIEVRWTGGIFGTGFYAGKVLVASNGLMTPYYVAGGGFMTSFANQYTGQSANSVVMTFNGVVRKVS